VTSQTNTRNRQPVFALYDIKSDVYTLLNHNGTAPELVRSYQAFMEDPRSETSPLRRHAADFCVYQLAWFYPEDGSFDHIERKLILQLLDVTPAERPVQIPSTPPEAKS